MIDANPELQLVIWPVSQGFADHIVVIPHLAVFDRTENPCRIICYIGFDVGGIIRYSQQFPEKTDLPFCLKEGKE